MKYLSIILSLIIFLFTSCQEKEVTYKQFSANDKSYTVHIPSDFSLENSIGNSMAFVKSNSNSKSDFSTILIYETDNGRGLIAELKYSVREDNGTTTEHELVTNL